MDNLIAKWKGILDEERVNIRGASDKESLASGIFLDNNDEDCDKSSKKYKSSQAIHKYSPKMAKESHDISKDSKRPKTNQQLSHTHQLEPKNLGGDKISHDKKGKNALHSNQFFMTALNQGDIIEKCVCTIFEIILSSDSKIRLKEKFQHVIHILKNMFNAQNDIITSQTKSLEDFKKDFDKQKIGFESQDDKLRDLANKWTSSEESKLILEKTSQINEIKCHELEKRLEQNLFNRKTLEMLSSSQKLLEDTNKELRIEINKRRDDSVSQEKIWGEQVNSLFKIIEKLKEELTKLKKQSNL